MLRQTHRHWTFASPIVWGAIVAVLLAPLGVGAAPAASTPPAAPSLQQLFRQSAPAVVLITQLDAAGKWTSLGSGFVVSPSGIIVTNHHVIAPNPGAVKLSIKVPRGDVYTDVRIVYAEARRDFAVVSIKAVGLPTLKVGDSDTVEVGDQVVAIGNPKGLELTFTSGIVGSIRLDPAEGYRFIQHQAPISHGSSGGPLINMKGEVIGINTFFFNDAQNLNGAMPINYVKPYFGDAPGVTWEKFAHISAAGAPPPPPAATAPPPSPSTPPPASGGSAPGTVFGTLSFYRPQDKDFRDGFAAGLYDMVTLFAATAEGSGKIDSDEVLSLFRCLDSKGDELIQLRTWMESTVTQRSSNTNIVVEIVARECQTSFASGKLLFFEHNIANYRNAPDTYKAGFAAGVYDAVSMFAATAKAAAGVEQKARALHECLDSKGEQVGDLRNWVDSTIAQTATARAVVLAVVDTCQRQ